MGIVAFNSFTQVCIRPCLCVALFFSIFNSAQADFELTSVEDLRYGSALYKYYLNDYLGAMAELQIAKQKGGIKGHGVNPNIMEGGIAMSYAMPKYAIDIFNVLLEENRSQKAQDSAWFYLAKLAYEQGKWKQVSSLLEKINSLPHESLQKDINTLQINTLLQLNDPESALSFVNNSVINFDELPFIYFNLGGAFARQNNHNRALTFFKKFKDPSFQKNLKTNEEISLYNQAMVAAGYSSLAVEQYAQAVYYFKSVQVNSHLKNKALLGYGWAEIAMNQPEEAIKPWLLLNESNYLDEYQLESGIAIPYAYERQGDTQQALEYYKVSEVKLLGYLAEIEIIKSEIEKVGVIQALNIKNGR